MIRTITTTKRFVVCPHCEQTTDSSIDHLKDGQYVVWGCNHCGRSYNFTMAGDATVVEKDPKARRSIATLVLLEYPPSDKPLRFLIAGSRSVDKDDVGKKAEHGASAFFYEQHSCPTNWIGNAEVIAYDGNPDPHGFLRYVREIDRPDLPDECMEEDRAYFALFPELLSQEPIKPR